MAPVVRAPRRRGGFTLIELLVAIAILGILGMVVVSSLWDNVDDAKQIGAKTKVDSIKTMVMQYRRIHNDLPGDLSVLTEEDPRHGNRPWLQSDEIRDTWGNQMIIKKGDRPGEFEIISFGADGIENGFDLTLGYERDISSNRPLDEEEGRP
ncbi:MAG: prepilin-type N-terminal cleavage/methylation domain-containing protein [Planctomycetes bacterium]|nr:prepilin-type N-terminal cleavage/methylation domain-containing protein [Planctomycetota bacterium]